MPDPEKPMSDELDVAGKVLQELGPHAADFAARITGSATNELGEALADRARLRRFRTQIKILQKAQKAAEKAGLPASVVPIKVLAPLLEFGGLEDENDEDMVARWANLLANAATGSPGVFTPTRLENLARLGLISRPSVAVTPPGPGRHPVSVEDAAELSALGADFVRACQPPSATSTG
jgi:hypothetical protein